jgi:hypothetical protein
MGSATTNLHNKTRALGKAISHFIDHDYIVSAPLASTNAYDLIIDDDGQLQRVVVKSTISRHSPSYEVRLSAKTYKSNKNKDRRLITKDDCDLVFIATPEDCYLFPILFCENRGTITLSPDKDAYRIDRSADERVENEDAQEASRQEIP